MAGPVSREDLSRLKAVFDGAMAPLDGAVEKTLFGCDGYFVNGNIFGLVWREGRLGLRLVDAASRRALLETPGSSEWRMGATLKRSWVLLPVSMHGDPVALRGWCRAAWEQARARPARRGVPGQGAGPKVRKAVFPRVDGGQAT